MGGLGDNVILTICYNIAMLYTEYEICTIAIDGPEPPSRTAHKRTHTRTQDEKLPVIAMVYFLSFIGAFFCWGVTVYTETETCYVICVFALALPVLSAFVLLSLFVGAILIAIMNSVKQLTDQVRHVRCGVVHAGACSHTHTNTHTHIHFSHVHVLTHTKHNHAHT